MILIIFLILNIISSIIFSIWNVIDHKKGNEELKLGELLSIIIFCLFIGTPLLLIVIIPRLWNLKILRSKV